MNHAMWQFALKVASPGITSLRVVYTDHARRPSDTFHCPSQANVFRLPGQTPPIARAMQGSEIRDALAYRREHLIYQAGPSQELTTKLAIREAAHRLKLYNSAKFSGTKRHIRPQTRFKRFICGSRTCKPNSVCGIAPAGRSFLWAAHYCVAQATYPEVVTRRAGTFPRRSFHLTQVPPYLVLLRVGFALPAALLPRRCALTAPFHPYPAHPKMRQAVCFLWH